MVLMENMKECNVDRVLAVSTCKMDPNDVIMITIISNNLLVVLSLLEQLYWL